MAQGIIGTTFTFQVLFVDGQNVPIAVDSPTIQVFKFSSGGVKQVLVDSVAMTAVPDDTGRYTYPFLISTLLPDGDILYAEMSGVDPGTEVRLLAEQEVTVIATGGSGGMTSRFVKGG